MANRWERGKLGPYTLPNDFTTGGVGINGISSVTPKEEPFLIPPSTVVYFSDVSLVNESDNLVVCSGQALSRTDDSALFDVLGTTFGAGDGSTTFNIPNLHHTVNRVHGTAAASGIGELQVGVMWDHHHSYNLLEGNAAVRFTPTTFPQPLTSQDALTHTPVPQPAVEGGDKSVTAFIDGPYSVPNPQIGPSYGPTEARYRNSKGIFPGRAIRMFPTIATVNTPIPIGGIIPFIGNDDLTPFDGYLLCNGQAVSASEFPNAALAGITSTPDLRGRFLANFVAPAPGPSIAFPNIGANHRHRTTRQPNGPLNPKGVTIECPLITTGTFNVRLNTPFGTNPVNFATDNKATGSASLGPGNETRPVNMAVNYFMRCG